jgi:hypothetical protein
MRISDRAQKWYRALLWALVVALLTMLVVSLVSKVFAGGLPQLQPPSGDLMGAGLERVVNPSTSGTPAATPKTFFWSEDHTPSRGMVAGEIPARSRFPHETPRELSQKERQ